jgi:S1-C subfamily serine protease
MSSRNDAAGYLLGVNINRLRKIEMARTRLDYRLLLALGALIFIFGGDRGVHALIRSEENTIRIFEQISRGVVNITTTDIGRDFFFNPVPKEGSGSGVVVDELGHIVTNYHVISGGGTVEVTLNDGSRWEARVVGKSPASDLAVIKIDAPKELLKPIPLGSSKRLQVGQKVLAVGNPFGLGQTLTTGTISSVGRDVRINPETVIRKVIQTDAAINPGNSGGPLINSAGEVIGISTAIFSPTGSYVGIGFAIPSDTVRRILPGLVSIWPKFVSWLLAVTIVALFLWWFWRRLTAPHTRGWN